MVCNCKYCNGDVDAHLEAEYAKYEVRISHIKTATPEELMQNDSVRELVDRLRREIRNGMNHFDDCLVFFEEAEGFDIDASEADICNCGAAWEYEQSLLALEPFKKEGSDEI